MASPDKQVGKNKHFIQSARHALDGLKVFFVDENNFKREFLSATLVIVAGVVLQVSAFSWFVLVLAILLVFLGELLNTIVENVVDFIVGDQYDARAKKIKDMSAGAVLIVSLIAVVAGIYVFGPPLLALFRSW
ncbi:diacylglycerol kinase family protein [Lacticaseibacillus paracasei]|uniref:diacylglycerol kinase n=1 Tax=Lacticaseibacillus paracasei TaxID=1597 RepID=UPI0031F4E81F